MPSGNNSYVFCANYSPVANCLFAIQAVGDSGGLAAYPEILRLLKTLEGDVLKKLYNKTIVVLGILEGVTITHDYLLGDFEYLDFSALDFNDGYLDERNNGYSSRFQTVLNIFDTFCSRSSELTYADIQSLTSAFIAVLNIFTQLQTLLIRLGLNICVNIPQYFNNSTSLYLQAAGADGSGGIPQGIHLRWSLTNDMGNNHLPQGDYYNTRPGPTGYNRANDYVVLSRTPYTNQARFTLDFQTAVPAVDSAGYQWTYVLNFVSGTQHLTNLIRLSFRDQAQYRLLATAGAPQAAPFAFLKLYNGQIALEIDQKTAFAVGYDFRRQSGSSASLKMQAISISETGGVSAETVSIRKTVTAATGAPVTGTFFGENLTRVQFNKSANGYLQSLSFETYDDFLKSRTPADWTVVGSDFALSLTDSTVFKRLETTAYPINDLWPQYRDGTRLRVANYRDKWLNTHPNEVPVKTVIQTYLTLSETDPRAEGVIKSVDAPADDPGIAISYLDVLNLMSFDFHWARMLGLGHIDTQVNDLGSGAFIYQISYLNRQNLSTPAIVNYQYLSIPTGLSDSRLPEEPAMRPLTHAMSLNNGLPMKGIDSQGYLVNSDQRVVNIGRELYDFEQPGNSFFDNFIPADFNLFERTQSIYYGIEYRPVSQPAYVKPAITSNATLGFAYYAYDTDFPVTGLLETAPVPDNPTSLYIHLEDQAGAHAYAIYGINWFSRASGISNEEQTDQTTFPLHNTLLPPPGLAVQYIQQEDTLLFTTQEEQDWLSGRAAQFPGEDINFTRIVFTWLDIIDLSHVRNIAAFDFSSVVKPTKVKAWFKSGQPLQLVGVIVDVVPVNNPANTLQVTAGTYSLLDGTQVSPIVNSADLTRFIGSPLITAEGQFAIISITETAGIPSFVVSKLHDVITVSDPNDPLIHSTRDTYTLPAIGSRFTVTENLTDAANWQSVQEDIQLISYIDPAAPVIESSTDDQGTVTRHLIGGIYGNAVVLQLLDVTDQSILPGYYSVSFDPAVNLAPHPQINLPFDPAFPGANSPGTLQVPDVAWYNGQVRVPFDTNTTSKKVVEVIRIVQTNPLLLYVYDSTYQDEPIRISATASDLVAGVNFHPGYKAYLFPEPAPTYAFNGANILPGTQQSSKKSLIGLQSTDTGTAGSGFTSRISPPAVMLAVKIVPPVLLDIPITYGLKVRPDATTKAALTFDIKIAPDSSGNARSPFGFMFYRTTHEDVLEALYAPATITVILGKLANLTQDIYFNERYLELVDLKFDPANPGHFNVFDAMPDPYGFPVPDKPGLTTGADNTLAKKTAKYQQAVMATLLPLTAQVPILSLIKTGYQTENKQPSIRTIDGNLIDSSDPSFDPFPMVRQYTKPADTNTTYVRFTDYSLNGSSRYLYFYGCAEVTDKLAIGPLSPFAGAVTILHTLPAEAPVIRYFTLGPPSDVSNSLIVPTFFITPFSSEDTITKVRILRTTDQNRSLSLSTMDSFTDVVISVDPQNGIMITDDFSDLSMIPFGEVIYYRLAFIRTIINEREESEDVLSLGSAVVMVNLIDTVNPEAPLLVYDAVQTKLTWSAAANKATYYVYRQNAKGNWQQVAAIPDGQPLEYQTGPLNPLDSNGNRVYYRFKVKVQNSSGLFNLTDQEYTI